MKSPIRTAVLAGLITISTTSVASPVFASTSSAASQVQIAGGQSCSNLTARIDAQILKIEKSIGNQVAAYEKQEARVSQVLARAKAANIDTTTAERNLSTWVSQTTQIKVARTNLVTDLNNLKTLQCVDQKIQYKQGLATAKSRLAEIKNLQKQKRDYFSNTIKVDLKQLSFSLRTR